MDRQRIGRVVAIAIRTAVRGPMQEVSCADAVTNGGLEGDIPSSPDRGITFLAKGDWSDVTRQLQADLPWHTRRANVLIDIDTLGHLIGKQVSIGLVEVAITGETKPCGLMDSLHAGLKNALKPNCRAGVHGHVLQSGTIRVGDEIYLNT